MASAWSITGWSSTASGSTATAEAIGLSGRLRIAARLAAMVVVLLGGVALYYAWRPFTRRNPWPRRFLRAFGRLAGARVSLRGRPVHTRAILLANHTTWLDIPVLAGATGTAFVSHAGLAGHPIMKRLCAMNDTVFVERTERGRVAEQVRQVREALGEMGSLTIFPEGTTGDGAALLPFKSSLLSALDPPPADLVVQPVWIDFGATRQEVCWVGDEGGLANVLRVLARREPVPVTLHFLAPFDPAAIGSRKAIAAEARARIEAAMSPPPARGKG